MGYLFLFISIFAGATKGYCGKRTGNFLTGFREAMTANIVRMILCIVIGLAFVIFEGNASQLIPTPLLLFISALSGITTAIFVVTWLVSVKKSAYMMLNVFLMMGLLIPLIAGNIFFQEHIKLTQWIGVGVLFAAVVILCSYNNSIKEKLTLSAFLILLASGIANGITDFSQKLFIKQLPEISASVFNFYTYIFAGITLVISLMLFPKEQASADLKQVLSKIYGYILVMALALFANSYFKTLAAEYLDTVSLYPLNQGASLILSTLMSTFLFHEKFTAKCCIGLILAFAGLLIINVL